MTDAASTMLQPPSPTKSSTSSCTPTSSAATIVARAKKKSTKKSLPALRTQYGINRNRLALQYWRRAAKLRELKQRIKTLARSTWSKLSHTLHMLGARQELDSLSGFRDEFEAVVDGQVPSIPIPIPFIGLSIDPSIHPSIDPSVHPSIH